MDNKLDIKKVYEYYIKACEHFNEPKIMTLEDFEYNVKEWEEEYKDEKARNQNIEEITEYYQGIVWDYVAYEQ
ncbi:hypothetical protein FDF26_15405 [Clostridium botulinum]|nr:hypothetical protein [Clostridium botulinum]